VTLNRNEVVIMKNRYLPVFIFFVMFAVILSGCTAEPDVPFDPDAARDGDIVRLHYTMRLDDGSVAFTTTNAGQPVEITLGLGAMIPAFEEEVIGMKPGEKKTVTIPAKDAYGPHRPELVIDVPRSQLPGDQEPQVGMKLQSQAADGTVIIATIVEVSEDSVKLDTNNEFAGKDLTYEIELVEIL
jgi:peptidylprolyl isomerase